MKKIVLWLFIVVFELMAILTPSFAYAQSAYSGLAAINKIILGTPGISSTSIKGLTTTTATAIETATLANGLKIPIPITAAIATAAARFGPLAAKTLITGASMAGLATIIVPWIVSESNYQACSPAEGFFCKIVSVATPEKYGWVARDGTIGTYAQAVKSVMEYLCPSVNTSSNCTSPVYGWKTLEIRVDSTHYDLPVYSESQNRYFGVYTFRTYYTLSDGSHESSKLSPLSENDLAQSLTNSLSKDAVKQQIMNDSLRKNNIPFILPTDTVITSAPPVTLTPIVETSTVDNSDGTTSTKTVTSTTTVNPQKTGTTVADTSFTYPTTTTTTTTTINNTTNVQNTSNSTKTENASAPDSPTTKIPDSSSSPASDIQLPDDYNREVTQQSILEKLTGTGVPDSSTINADTDLGKITSQNSTNKSAFDSINNSYLGLVNWFPSFPTAVCVNPTVPNPISHALVAIDICTPLGIFKTFISGVLCFFVLIASVREVQGAIKS
jgi:hypothetical protein